MYGGWFMELRDFITLGSDISYRDVLSDQFYAEYFATKDRPEFLAVLKKYKQISKTNVAAIDERISALDELGNVLNQEDIYLIDIRKNILKIAPFFMYLEQNCDYDLIPQIEYFSDEKLEMSKILINDGKLYTSDGNLLTTDDREFLFILGKNNEFYGCYSKKSVKHTSLSHGDSIKCGGAITVKDGNITSIGLDSGHYFPSLIYLNKLVYYLERSGVKVSKDTPVNYHENFVRKSITLEKGISR